MIGSVVSSCTVVSRVEDGGGGGPTVLDTGANMLDAPNVMGLEEAAAAAREEDVKGTVDGKPRPDHEGVEEIGVETKEEEKEKEEGYEG